MAPPEPTAQISHLHRADGSATFSYGGYAVVASANGPVESQRRDENPDEAVVDVIVRPAAGVGGTRERQLESILQKALGELIPLKNFPKLTVQVTLQVTETPENDYVNAKLLQAQSNLPVIPALLHAAILGLLSAAVPLKATAVATTIAVTSENGHRMIIIGPSPVEINKARSIHVLAFTSHDELLFCESEGQFTLAEWNDAVAAARKACADRTAEAGDDTAMGDSSEQDTPDMRQFIRSTVAASTAAALHWKSGR